MDAVASGDLSSDETSAAYGEVVWSWRRDPGATLTEILRRQRGQERPLPRGEHEVSRKTIARGRPGLFGCTSSSNPCAFFRTRGYGRSRRPAFPAPSTREGQRDAATRAKTC